MYPRICFAFLITQSWFFVGKVRENMSFVNDCASIELYKQSMKGTLKDFIISFNEEQTDMEQVLMKTQSLFLDLIDSHDDQLIKARLVAKVRFVHINNVTDEMEERFYHFPSYQAEHVIDMRDFYQRHMMKIAKRLDSFNQNGSNLLIKNIAHIHILLTTLSCKQTKRD